MNNSGVLIFWLVVWLIFGLIGMGLADDKGRSRVGGFLTGAFLGIPGFIILALIPMTAEKRTQRRVIAGKAKVCPHCYSEMDIRATVCPHCQREAK